MKSLTMKSLLYLDQLMYSDGVDLWHTENFSRVNCGPRIDVREVVWVRTEAVSRLDVVRSEESIITGLGNCLALRVCPACSEALSRLPHQVASPDAVFEVVADHHQVRS